MDSHREDTRAAIRVGRNVRRHREIAGLTQKQLAEAMGSMGLPTHVMTLSNIERGERLDVTVDELEVLARIFGVPPADLLADAEDPDAVWFRDRLTRLAHLLARRQRAARDVDSLMYALHTIGNELEEEENELRKITEGRPDLLNLLEGTFGAFDDSGDLDPEDRESIRSLVDSVYGRNRRPGTKSRKGK